MSSKIDVVVLAAGKGSRMNSNISKPLQPLMGKTLIEHVLASVETLDATIHIVVNAQNEKPIGQLLKKSNVHLVQQTTQNGSGGALQTVIDFLSNPSVIVINADTPLITSSTIQQLASIYDEQKAHAALLVSDVQDAGQYGRVIIDDKQVKKIVEAKDANENEIAISTINSGIYLFNTKDLKQSISQLEANNKQQELYLTDVIEKISSQEKKVVANFVNENEILGVNDKEELEKISKIKQRSIIQALFKKGVTFINKDSVYIEEKVEIGQDTTIEHNVFIKGDVVIGKDVQLLSGTYIEGPAVIGEGSKIGPNAHIRPNTVIERNVYIGNYVELKNTTIGEGTHVGHLSYVGDAYIGKKVNVGAGSIFVNYDGKNKHRSFVGDRSFIGSGTKVIAPVLILEEGMTAAGSTITDNVLKHEMGIARSFQINKSDFWDRMPHEDDLWD